MLPRNWGIKKTLQSVRKLLIFEKKKEKSYASWSGITNSESILLRSWLTEQLWRPTFLIKLLLPRVQGSLAAKLECRKIHEEMSIIGNFFARQHPRWDPDEVHIDPRNLATPSGIISDFEDSEKTRNWQKWERRTIAMNTFTLLFSQSEQMRNKSYVYD